MTPAEVRHELLVALVGVTGLLGGAWFACGVYFA